MKEVLEMSEVEISRVKTLHLVIEKKISQIIAAKRLNLSARQVRSLLKRLKEEGDKGLISKKRGKSSNHQLDAQLKTKVLCLVRELYEDFGPQLANEYLKNYHEINISTETLRRWMIETHLWIPRCNREKKRHLPRERRRHFGELIQGDGSHHYWFENRSEPCVLMVFIDDATSVITSMYFSETESLEAYYHTLEKHIKFYGIPRGFYGDRCSVLTPRTQIINGEGTQFHKALKELGCELILAHSAQAKGRVERVNRTLQDRLVKELRIKGISNIEEANIFLEEYRVQHNKIFSKKPSEQIDAHRPLEGISLENVLSIREERTLSKDYVVQFKNTFYEISPQEKNAHLFKGAKIEIRESLSGNMIALFKGKVVSMKPLSEIEDQLMDEKKILNWKPMKHYIPPSTHPYKNQSYVAKMKEKIV